MREAKGNPASPYPQHRDPLRCPKGHRMGWLGSRWWMCYVCRVIFGEV